MIARIFSTFEVLTLIVVLSFVLIHLILTLYRVLLPAKRKPIPSYLDNR